eukprot:1151892-Pelagomonas_calceolata.AAC.7
MLATTQCTKRQSFASQLAMSHQEDLRPSMVDPSKESSKREVIGSCRPSVKEKVTWLYLAKRVRNKRKACIVSENTPHIYKGKDDT